MLSSMEAAEAAKEYHVKVRSKDFFNLPAVDHLLINSSDKDILKLPSYATVMEKMMTLCGANHDGHIHGGSEACFREYAKLCKSSSYAPAFPVVDELPYSYKNLPGGVPVLDHLDAMLYDDQAHSDILINSYLPLFSESLNLCKDNRQISLDSQLQVTTIVFSESPVSEVKQFIDSFNKAIYKLIMPSSGNMPSSYYYMDVFYIDVGSQYKATIHTKRKGQTHTHTLLEKHLPARISFCLWDQR